MSNVKGNTNASKRKQLSREAVRLRVRGEKCIGELENIVEELKVCDKESVPALKARSDIQFGLLKKVLPDLRSVELSVAPTDPMADFLRSVQAGAIEGEVTESPKKVDNGSGTQH